MAIDDYPWVLPAEPAISARRPEGAFAEFPAVIALDVEPVLEVLPSPPALAPLPSDSSGLGFFGVIGAVWNVIASVCEWLFGAIALIVGLAVLAALPLLQFLSLGYLLEAGGRIARTGRLRDGFIGVRKAARLGSVVIGAWLMLLPLRLISSLWTSAQIIDPDGPIARRWKVALFILTVMMACHIAMACARGGKLRYFFWPFNFIWLIGRLWRGGFYRSARDATWDFVVGLRLPYYFWLGLRGFAGTMILLLMPITLLALGRFFPPLGFLGAFQLMYLLMYLPFLQMRFACENRFAAMFEWWEVWNAFRRAPWAFAFAFFVTLLFALPLYLLKIEIVPREAAWLPGIFFILSIFPARLLAGWAYGRARRRATPRNWFFRWTGNLAMVPVTIFYVVIVFFTQFLAWGGVWSLYEQHAFLLPVPFVGL